MKRRTEITVETDCLLVVSTTRRRLSAWCEDCGECVEMVGACEAAEEARVSERTVHQWVDTGLLHFAETHAGRLLVCRRSLRRRFYL
jgi:hypothetical protein